MDFRDISLHRLIDLYESLRASRGSDLREVERELTKRVYAAQEAGKLVKRNGWSYWSPFDRPELHRSPCETGQRHAPHKSRKRFALVSAVWSPPKIIRLSRWFYRPWRRRGVARQQLWFWS